MDNKRDDHPILEEMFSIIHEKAKLSSCKVASRCHLFDNTAYSIATVYTGVESLTGLKTVGNIQAWFCLTRPLMKQMKSWTIEEPQILILGILYVFIIAHTHVTKVQKQYKLHIRAPTYLALKHRKGEYTLEALNCRSSSGDDSNENFVRM